MRKVEIKKKFRSLGTIEPLLKRQFYALGIITELLKPELPPILVGGCALAYYTRGVYQTADIDIAYQNTNALDKVLRSIGFKKEGRYWFCEEIGIAIEVPVSSISDAASPIEEVEIGEFRCYVVGIEDLIIDRLNACKYWESRTDCEMAELLLVHYKNEIDLDYLKKRASQPENDTWGLIEEALKDE